MPYCRIERSQIKRNFNCYSNVAVTILNIFVHTVELMILCSELIIKTIKMIIKSDMMNVFQLNHTDSRLRFGVINYGIVNYRLWYC